MKTKTVERESDEAPVETPMEEVVVEEASADEGPPTPPSARRRLLFVGLLVVTALIMASGLIAWYQAAHDKDVARAETRDAVLIQGRQNIETINSLDYRSVDKGLDSWLAITTGTLHDQLAAVGPDERKLLADQKKISTARVVDAAVLDLDGDSATVIAAVEITVADDPSASTEPTVKRNRFSADLVEVQGRWKLENIQQVAVSLP